MNTEEERYYLNNTLSFYWFAFDDPVFILDKAPDSDKLHEHGSDDKQIFGTLLTISRYQKEHEDENILIIAPQSTLDKYNCMQQNYNDLFPFKRKNIVFAKHSAKSISKYQNTEYGLIIIDGIDDFMSPTSDKTKALLKLSATHIFMTTHKQLLKTQDFSFDTSSTTLRNCNGNNETAIKTFDIACTILENAGHSPDNEKIALVNFINKYFTGQTDKDKYALFLEDIDKYYSENEKNLKATKVVLYEKVKLMVVGRYLYSFGLEYYSRKNHTLDGNDTLDEAKIRLNLQELNNYIKGIATAVDEKKFINNYRSVIQGKQL